MKILITGANGLLGQSLIKQLKKKHEIYAITQTQKDFDNDNIIQMDLTNIDESLLPTDIDVVYYLAQSRRFREFPGGAEDMLGVNVYAPVKLASWAQKNGVKKFIYASSGGVYKNPTEPVHEFFSINANEKNGFYLDSKLSAEILLKNFENLFETFVIVRPFFMYGPEQNKSMLIPRLMNNILNGNEITLSGIDGIRINPVFIGDAAMAMLKLLDIKGKYLFNIAGNEIITLRNLCDMIGKITVSQPIYNISNTKQTDLIADITLMKKKLYSPQTSLNEGIHLMYSKIKK